MSTDRELHTIEETAADWMIERDRGMSRARERELTRWLQADERHAAAFEALAATWTLLGEAPRPAAEADGTPARSRRTSRRIRFPLLLAAAAAVAVAYVGGWRIPARGERDATSPFTLTAATAVGVWRTINLPDGSVIQLNTDSAVDVHFTPQDRRVSLTRGEAHFTVAKHRARPFIVNAAGVDVRVVGTVFNVRLRSEAVDVLVTEGKVRVDAAEKAVPADVPLLPAESELGAGQKLSIDRASQAATATALPVTLSTTAIKQALAWQSRRLDFDAAPLAEIVAEINRYNRHKLVIGDPRLDVQRFGGSFPAGDYETVVRMLEANFGVVAQRRAGETTLRLKAP